MSTAVAKKQDAKLPDYLKGRDNVAVNDNFTQDDIIIPRLKLLQGASDEVSTFDEARSGEFWNTGAGVSLGSDISFTIAARNRKYLLIAPMEDGKGVLARADDAEVWDRTGSWEVKIDRKTKVEWEISDLNVEKSGLSQWGSSDPSDENSPPAATLIYDYLVIVDGREDLGPMVLSLARSAIRAGKDLNTKIRMRLPSVGGHLAALKFSVKPQAAQNDAGQDYWVPLFKNAGYSGEDSFQLAEASAGLLTTYRVEGEEDDAATVVDDADTDRF